jgi:hypothetical protein
VQLQPAVVQVEPQIMLKAMEVLADLAVVVQDGETHL